MDTNLPAFPGHDPGMFVPVPTRIAASWPVGHFAENLVVAADGSVLVSLHSHKRIDRYDLATDSVSTWATLPAPVAGLVFDGTGALWATGGELGVAPGIVWRLDGNGAVTHWLDIPDAVFLNGAALHADGRRLLVAESVTGRILAVDTATPGVTIWLADEYLKPQTAGTPGANGVKLFGGFVHVSVTARNLLLRAPIEADGSCGPAQVWASQLRADDFAFDASGSAFVATHPANSILRLAPDGTRTTLAGPLEGAVGATAVAIAPNEPGVLYATTNGGLWSPFEGQVQPAKLLRLEVGTPRP